MTAYVPNLFRLVLFLVVFAAGVGAQKIGLIAYVTDPYEYPYILALLWQHLYLVAISMFLATALGLGIGMKPAIFALTIYSILPIARNTLAGIISVPPALLDAAKGMGMPPRTILWEVELPNALRVIITGFRIALIINIGTAALAFLIGAGGLGDLIFTGISLMEPDRLLAGAIPVTLLALLADFLCDLGESFLVPRGLRLSQR
jgi:osmoprotectant transport system permease protein